METETIKSKRLLPQSMGDLYLLKNERDILEMPEINRGYVMALNHKGNLYSYSFAQCDNSHEIGELDRIIVKEFIESNSIVPIPFDVDGTIGGNSLALESYLNQHFGNKPQILKRGNGLSLFQRDSNGCLNRSESSLVYPKSHLSSDIMELLLYCIAFINIPIIDYVSLDDD